jgi:hypothetical protein
VRRAEKLAKQEDTEGLSYLEDHHRRHWPVRMPDYRPNGHGIDAGLLAGFAGGCFPDAISTSLICPLKREKSQITN